MSEPLLAFDAQAVLHWARLATAGLRSERARIDDLNVFPVADSDTGTNLLLTFVDGATALEERLAADSADANTIGAGEALVTLARGALRGARGSSGTILSQILLGFASEVVGLDTIHRADFARALRKAADTAWEAVSTPVPGTILSVVRTAADAATELEGSASAIIARTVGAARTALIETENQLSVLKAAGVVDAGGSGLVILLEALLAAVKGQEELPARASDGLPARRAIPDTPPVAPELVPLTGPSDLHAHLYPDAHQVDGEFEVMFLVDDDSPNAGQILRTRLQEIGSSVVVVGGAGLWHVHVHCDDVLAALTVTAAQRRHQVTVHHLPTLVAREEGRDIGLVLCTRSPGLAAELARSGAVVVITQGDEPASQEQISRAIVDTAAAEVVVAAARASALEAARELAALPGIAVRVIDQAGEAYLLAAAAVHQPVRSEDHDPIKAIVDAVTRVRTVSGDAYTVGQVQKFDDWLRGNLADAELVTALVTSDEIAVTAEQAEACVAARRNELNHVSALCDDLGMELEVLYGGQETPPIIWSVE
ncbi:MAG TPA: DAK2 domain-containing protein [Actinomycetales bacterium]|nr:DAK2 domain-containing protein [Actinomycetales bacterium]